MVAVRIVTLEASRVFNLTSPRWLPELSLNWKGRLPWHDSRYDLLRDAVEYHYVKRFNESSGHYIRLEESVRKTGFRNPIVITTGKLIRRKPQELPPGFDMLQRPVCEWVGGSRLLVAEKLKMHIPCVVNDYANLYPAAPRLSPARLFKVFQDRPGEARWRPDGSLMLNYFPYTQFDNPAERRAVRAQQTPLRRAVIEEIQQLTKEWLGAHDG